MWYESGGEGSRTVLLLHGLGATAAVWGPLAEALQVRAGVRWLAPDLGGHGGSDWQGFYSVGQLAAQLAHDLQADAAEHAPGRRRQHRHRRHDRKLRTRVPHAGRVAELG